MNPYFKSSILQSTGASSLKVEEVIQELWSGYGNIMRVSLQGASIDSVVVKHVQIPNLKDHPRGWNTDIGHQRKVKSYEVETAWYQTYSQDCKARIPNCLAVEKVDDEVLMVLEDLDQAGYPIRKNSAGWDEISACLRWLAKLHASFLGRDSVGLWEVGTYWHLETRPDELRAMTDHKLRAAAPLIDQALNDCEYQTLVHGDAKLANFCFSKDGQVAGVDFQYVGGGCGIKDVAYFVGSCMNEKECERLESQILDTYFDALEQELEQENQALEEEWRSLYHVAWADFHRFLKGWSPRHWKINSYSERITANVIERLH